MAVVPRQQIDALSQLANLHRVLAVNAATTGVLANSPTYANGQSGQGATLTAGSNAAFATIDGVTAALGNRYLVKNEATGANRGVYQLTTVGDGSTPWVLTRATDWEQGFMFPSGVILIAAGTVNGGRIYYCSNTSAPTMGSTTIAFSQVVSNPPQHDVFLGDGATTAFTLMQTPLTSTSSDYEAFVDGQLQSPEQYSVSSTTFTFGTAPPAPIDSAITHNILIVYSHS